MQFLFANSSQFCFIYLFNHRIECLINIQKIIITEKKKTQIYLYETMHQLNLCVIKIKFWKN